MTVLPKAGPSILVHVAVLLAAIAYYPVKKLIEAVK